MTGPPVNRDWCAVSSDQALDNNEGVVDVVGPGVLIVFGEAVKSVSSFCSFSVLFSMLSISSGSPPDQRKTDKREPGRQTSSMNPNKQRRRRPRDVQQATKAPEKEENEDEEDSQSSHSSHPSVPDSNEEPTVDDDDNDTEDDTDDHSEENKSIQAMMLRSFLLVKCLSLSQHGHKRPIAMMQ